MACPPSRRGGLFLFNRHSLELAYLGKQTRDREELDMAITIAGIISLLGYLFALVAVVNFHFSSDVPLGRAIIGAIGLIIAFLYTISIQEKPLLQRIATFCLLGLAVVMAAPSIWRLFWGTDITVAQVTLAVLGSVLFFICWQMLPRYGG
jgi:hypothetical protein